MTGWLAVYVSTRLPFSKLSRFQDKALQEEIGKNRNANKFRISLEVFTSLKYFSN